MKARSGSLAWIAAAEAAFSALRARNSAWYSGVWCSAARSSLLAVFADSSCATAGAGPAASAAAARVTRTPRRGMAEGFPHARKTQTPTVRVGGRDEGLG